jgi:hypothetical protein
MKGNGRPPADPELRAVWAGRPPADPELRAAWDEAMKDNETLNPEDLEQKRRALRIELLKKLVEAGAFTRQILASTSRLTVAGREALPILEGSNLEDATQAAESLRTASEQSELRRRDRFENFLATLPTGDSAEKLLEWVEQIARLDSNIELLFEACDVAAQRLFALRKAAKAAATVLHRIDTAEAAGRLIALSGPE